MCYHYSLTKKMQEVMKMIEAEWENPFEPVYHAIGFEFTPMPVITTRCPRFVFVSIRFCYLCNLCRPSASSAFTGRPFPSDT